MAKEPNIRPTTQLELLLIDLRLQAIYAARMTAEQSEDVWRSMDPDQNCCVAVYMRGLSEEEQRGAQKLARFMLSVTTPVVCIEEEG